MQAAAIVRRLLPHTRHRPLLACLAALRHDVALAEGDGRGADRSVAELVGVADPLPYLDMDIRCEGRRRHVLNLVQAGDLSSAHSEAACLFQDCGQAGMQVQAVDGLLLIANVHLAAKHYTGALPYLLSCMLHAAGSHQYLLAAEAMLLLSHAWLSLSPALKHEVLLMLQDAMPIIMAHGSLELQARSQKMLADVLAAGTKPGKQLKARAPQIRQLLEGSLTCYRRLHCAREAAGVAYLLAQLHDALGDVESRDREAQLYCQLVSCRR
ncbi:hypothetical protein V8C86DRAFT_2683707 [Haematococcus lacustris]